MRTRIISASAVLILGATAPAGERVADRVAVTIDGTPSRAEVISVEGGLDVAEGDLIAVGAFLLTRGTEPTLTFRTEPGRLWQKFADGRERVVCAIAAALRPGQEPDEDVHVGGTTHMGVKPQRDTFAGLGDTDIAGLRGVVVVNWSDTVAAEVAKVDAAHACFVVSVCKDDPIPPLPAGARHVVLSGFPNGSESVPGDLTPLARLADLRLLKLGWHFGGATDLTPLSGLKELRRLDLDFRELGHAEALGKLTSLRVLDLTGCKPVEDAEFLRPLAHLVSVSVASTKVADLSPLSDHAELREIQADLSRLRVLPGGELPALREFRLLSVPAPRRQIEAFAKAHPQCDLVYGWRGLLARTLAKADRVRVRTGGTCHRRPKEEALVLELKARSDIDDLLATLRLDENAPGDMCMCCGDPTLEFYEGEKLVVSLGYHHGRTLRWPGGPWPGDARLVPEAATSLSEWLAQRGATGPKEEIEEMARDAAALAARDAEQDEVLGKERIAAIHGAADVETAAKLFAEWFPGRDARLPLLLRLASRPTRSGNTEVRDRVVAQAEWVLAGQEDPAAVLGLLAGRIASGGADARSAAEFVDSLRDGRFDAEALETLRLAAARVLLAAGESHRAVSILGDSKSKAADEILLALLPPVDERGDPRGTVTSVHVEVALDLAGRCDPALLPRLRAIVGQERDFRGYDLERFDRIVAGRTPSPPGK